MNNPLLITGFKMQGACVCNDVNFIAMNQYYRSAKVRDKGT
jgi:hypothetical protein